MLTTEITHDVELSYVLNICKKAYFRTPHRMGAKLRLNICSSWQLILFGHVAGSCCCRIAVDLDRPKVSVP